MNNETRAVPRKHAELALSEAMRRMSAAIYQARNHNPDDPDQADVVEMVLEAASRAVSVAQEIETRLETALQDETLDAKQCFRDWLDWIDEKGPALDIAEDMERAV